MLRGDLKARVLGCQVYGLARLVQLTCDYYWQRKEYGFTELAVEKCFMYILHCISCIIDLCTPHSLVPEPIIPLPSSVDPPPEANEKSKSVQCREPVSLPPPPAKSSRPKPDTEPGRDHRQLSPLEGGPSEEETRVQGSSLLGDGDVSHQPGWRFCGYFE